MSGCKKGELSIRIDHSTSSLTFETDLFATSKNADADGAKLQASPAERMRDQLSRLAKCFYTTVHMIDPTIIESKKNAKAQALSRALAGMEEEHNNALARKAIIERRRELVETLNMRREKEKMRQRAIRQMQKDEELKQKQLEAVKKREQERKKRELEAIQKEEARKFAESLKAKNLKVQLEDLENLDTDRLVQLQVEQLEKEKRELNERLRTISKRMDHIERAYRKDEIPLLEKDYERQRKADRAYHEAARKLQLDTTASKHAEDLKLKEKLKKILPDYLKYRSEVENRRFEEFEERRRVAQAKLDEEKEKRRQLYRAKKEEERKIREAEEEARLRAEEEERRQIEEAQRAEDERRAREAAEKSEYEAKKRKLDEQAARQREVERVAEEKRLARERETEQKRAQEKERLESRRDSEKSTSTISAGTGYIPPALRRQTEDARRQSTDNTTKEELSWRNRRTGTGRANAPEDTQRRHTPTRRDTDDMWRRPAISRSSTTEETDRRRPEVQRRVTNEDGEWRRSESSKGDREPEWRRRLSKDNEDTEQPSSTSSRGPTRIARSDNAWKPRVRQNPESSTTEKTTSGRESWTATLREMEDDSFVADPEQDENLGERLSTSDSNKQPLPSEKQLPPAETNDGFTVVKGRRRKNQFSGSFDAE